MNIIVATCYTPFTHDRNARLVRELASELTRRGHLADTVLLPLRPDEDAAGQLLGRRLLDLTEAAGIHVDRVIAVGSAAMALRHPYLTGWSVDTMRPVAVPGLSEARRVHYAARADAHLNRGSRPVYPPIGDATGLEPAGPEPMFLWAGPLTTAGRATHALEAMRFVRSRLRLTMLADSAPTGSVEAVRAQAEEWGLTARVEVVVRPSPPERRELLRRCLGLLALHIDQPAPDDVVIEAFHARRPVLTFGDTAAVAGLIEDGVNGALLPPDPRLLALAMNRIGVDPEHRRRLGDEAFTTLARNGINWSYVAERLLS